MSGFPAHDGDGNGHSSDNNDTDDRKMPPTAAGVAADKSPILEEFPIDGDWFDDFLLSNTWNDLETAADANQAAVASVAHQPDNTARRRISTTTTLPQAEARYKELINMVVDYDKFTTFSRRKKSDQETVEIQKRMEIIMAAIEILQFCSDREDTSKMSQDVIRRRTASAAETLAKANQMLQDEFDHMNNATG